MAYAPLQTPEVSVPARHPMPRLIPTAVGGPKDPGMATPDSRFQATRPEEPDPPRDPAPAIDPAATGPLPAAPPLPQRMATFPYHPGDLILPGYRLTKRLGSGGFGEVWRAEAPGGMGVAIKILANLGRREGGREFRALQTIKNIRHAHIVPLFGVWLKTSAGRLLDDAELQAAEKRILSTPAPPAAHGIQDTHEAEPEALESLELIVAMGLGDQTLFDRLREAQRSGGSGLPVSELIPWIQQAALALDHFNSGQRRSRENITAVQHCDIKPQNMLLVGDVVQVCDFGLARAQGEVRATSNTMASLAYAAPEMVRPPYDPAPTTDQYSLALSYIELRTGRLPYTELSPLTIMRAKVDGTIDFSDVPPIEAKVLTRALQVDPTQRWPSCVDFSKALRAAAGTIADTGRFVVSAPLGATPAAVSSPSQPDASVQTVDSPQSGSPATVAVPAVQQPGVKRRGVPPGRLWAALAGAGVLLLAGIVALRPSAIPPVPVPPSPDPILIRRAEELERQGDLVGAGTVYAEALRRQPGDLASVLWNLQTRAADEHRPADCVPLLERLEKLYAAAPPPQVKGIGRWDIVNSLAWYKATLPGGNAAAGREAQRLAAEALTLVGSDPLLRAQTLDVAAAAAARAEQWDTALQQIDEALALLKDPAEQAEFRRRRSAYAAHQPWQEP